MNCQVVRACFEDPLRPDFDQRAAAAEVAEHVMSCAECSRFVEAQRRLGDGLRMARESAPAVPASLDAAVLANYREHAGERTPTVRASFAKRPRWLPVLLWSAAAVALLLVGMIALGPRRAAVPVAAKPQSAQPVAKFSTVNATGGDERGTEERIDSRPVAALPRRSPMENSGKPARAAAAMPGESLPASFRGLMYCDALSCGGAMEVIRVQLPASAAALAPRSVPSGEAVYADVLVGPDGIARGIRIVE